MISQGELTRELLWEDKCDCRFESLDKGKLTVEQEGSRFCQKRADSASSNRRQGERSMRAG